MMYADKALLMPVIHVSFKKVYNTDIKTIYEKRYSQDNCYDTQHTNIDFFMGYNHISKYYR